MKNLRGKQAVVVGAASGIGRGIALALAREGAGLYLIDINAPGLEATASEARLGGVEVFTAAADAADAGEVQRALSRLIETWGGCDILVNSAGNLYWGGTEQMTAGQCTSVLDANVKSVAYVTQALLPLLLAREEAHIVNVSSLGGLTASVDRAVYTAAKHGIVGFSRSLLAEYGRRGLGVTVLCPSHVAETNLFKSMMLSPGVAFNEPQVWNEVFTPLSDVADGALRGIRNNDWIVFDRGRSRSLWRYKRFFPGIFERLASRPRRGRRGLTRLLGQGFSTTGAPASKGRDAEE